MANIFGQKFKIYIQSALIFNITDVDLLINNIFLHRENQSIAIPPFTCIVDPVM